MGHQSSWWSPNGFNGWQFFAFLHLICNAQAGIVVILWSEVRCDTLLYRLLALPRTSAAGLYVVEILDTARMCQAASRWRNGYVRKKSSVTAGMGQKIVVQWFGRDGEFLAGVVLVFRWRLRAIVADRLGGKSRLPWARTCVHASGPGSFVTQTLSYRACRTGQQHTTCWYTNTNCPVVIL